MSDPCKDKIRIPRVQNEFHPDEMFLQKRQLSKNKQQETFSFRTALITVFLLVGLLLGMGIAYCAGNGGFYIYESRLMNRISQYLQMFLLNLEALMFRLAGKLASIFHEIGVVYGLVDM